ASGGPSEASTTTSPERRTSNTSAPDRWPACCTTSARSSLLVTRNRAASVPATAAARAAAAASLACRSSVTPTQVTMAPTTIPTTATNAGASGSRGKPESDGLLPGADRGGLSLFGRFIGPPTKPGCDYGRGKTPGANPAPV